MLEETFLGAVVGRASQTGQVDQNGDLGSFEGLRGQIEVERHLGLGGCGIVAQFEQLAAKRGDGGLGCDGHV